MPASRSRGFSMLELAVVIVVMTLVAAASVNALLRYQGEVERQTVEIAIRQMQTGLRLRILDTMMHGKRLEIAVPPGSNPIALRGEPMKDYAGERDGPLPDTEAGWYFDRAAGHLAYRPHSPAFAFNPGEEGELRWRIEAVAGSEMSVRLAPIAAPAIR